MKRLAIVALLALGMGGCRLPFFPEWDVVSRTQIDPDPVWSTWYSDVEECLGVSGGFAAITWFEADEIYRDGTRLNGYVTPWYEITLVRGASERAIRHEMVHHVLRAGNEIHDSDDRVPCDTWHGAIS